MNVDAATHYHAVWGPVTIERRILDGSVAICMTGEGSTVTLPLSSLVTAPTLFGPSDA